VEIGPLSSVEVCRECFFEVFDFESLSGLLKMLAIVLGGVWLDVEAGLICISCETVVCKNM
jgi:hypothetical protein